MINMTIHRDHDAIFSIASHSSFLLKYKKTDEEMMQSMMMHLENLNSLKFNFDLGSQVINKCMLIYDGIEHIVTIKFEI